jgi:hypothetical protein
MVVSPGNAMSFSAFEQKKNDDFGGQGARSLLTGDRYFELDRRASYYECTQHDMKFWDFDGRPISPKTMQPLIGHEQMNFVPLRMRRPSVPQRLGKVIVNSFTNLLFGENRFPTLRVEGDELSQDWHQTVARIGKLADKMIQARNRGGSAGTVGVSASFVNGLPRFEVHQAKNLFVHSWFDRTDLVPEHVSEVYLHSKTQWDGREFAKVWYWFRRDWTPEADVVFEDVLFRPDEKEITWIVDQDRTTFHGDGRCHLEWIQNIPTDEIDGLPDYDGLYENFDSIDLLMSVITKGAILNLDPTVKMKVDLDEWTHRELKKGSDHTLFVGKDGDADYLELSGQSIEAGLKLVDAKRKYIFETAECVVPNPDEVAAQGVSSVAIKAMFAPMLAKADILRTQYGSGVERILCNLEASARNQSSISVQVPDPNGVPDPVTGLVPMIEAEQVVNLPPKLVENPIIDPLTQQPSGEVEMISQPRQLGPGGELLTQWPPYFLPTPQDQAQMTQSLSTATGGKAFLSQETATEQMARAYGVEPSEEWKRVQEEQKAGAAAQAAMIGGDPGAMGGQVADPHQLPPGAEPHHPPPHDQGPPPAPHPDDPDADIPVDIDLT